MDVVVTRDPYRCTKNTNHAHIAVSEEEHGADVERRIGRDADDLPYVK